MTATTLINPRAAEPSAAGPDNNRSIVSHDPIPMSRLTSIELRKMFDTRAGFWLMAGIGLLSLVATAAVIVFATDADKTYDSFSAAIGIPMTILLPVVAILAVTSEWSQRSGLTTFTLVPHRSRVIWAKAIATLLVGVGSMLLAMGIGALGNMIGSTIAGVDTVWDVSIVQFVGIVAGNLVSMLMGFVLGLLLRNSAGAIVAYVAYSFIVPTITSVLAASQDWFADIQGYADLSYTSSFLFSAEMGGRWGEFATSLAIWMLFPLAIALWQLRRAEVK